MVIHYPGGQPYKSNTNKTKTKKSKINFSNRGMYLEELINQSIVYYRNHNQAIIHKKPIPVQIVNVDYPKRSAAKITEAYFRKASTTDYNGIYKGFYLDFEAKETRNKTSFPLNNFHQHQVKHMEDCAKHGGISFVIISFSSLNRYFLMEFSTLNYYWHKKDTDDGKKSIPLKEIENNCYEIDLSLMPRIDFLPIIDKIIKSL